MTLAPRQSHPAIIAIVAVAIALRWWSIGAESFWIDELFSLQTSAGNGLAHERLQDGQLLDPAPRWTDLNTGGGLVGIVRFAHEDTQAPLYYMLLNLWRHLLGSSEVAVRSLSAIAAVLSVLVVLQIARNLSTKSTINSVLATAIMAVSGAQIVFAQEARPYALALLLSTTAAWVVTVIERRGFSPARGGALAGTLLALLLTHYAGAAPASAIAVYAMIRSRGRARWLTLAVFAAAAVVFLALWVPVLWQQRGAGGHLAFLDDQPEGHLLRTLDRAACQPFMMLFAAPAVSRLAAPWHAVALVLGTAMIVAPPFTFRRRPELVLPWLLMVAAIALTGASDLLSTRAALELPRFSFLGSAGACMTLAGLVVGIAGGRQWTAAVAVPLLGLGATCFGGSIQLSSPFARDKPDARGWAAAVRQELHPGDILIIARPPADRWQAGALYLALSHYAPPPGPVIMLSTPPDARILATIHSSAGAAMISPEPTLPNSEFFPGSTIGQPIQSRNLGTFARLHLQH